MRWLFVSALFLVVVNLCILLADDLATSPDNDAGVRAAVMKSLPFLEEEGVAWMEERRCMSCHHVPLMLWTHHVARGKGIPIDDAKLAVWEDWARKDSLSRRNQFKLSKEALAKVDMKVASEELRKKLTSIINQVFATQPDYEKKLAEVLTAEELVQAREALVNSAKLGLYDWDRSAGGLDVIAHLSLDRYGVAESDASKEFRLGLREIIQQKQLDNGSWIPGNQYQSMRRWSRPTADEATTLWAALALAADEVTVPGQNLSPQLAKVKEYLQQQPAQTQNHELLAVRLLFAHKMGDATVLADLKKRLSECRNPDGGWGWEDKDPSDPYTTGLVLFALAEVGASDLPHLVQEARRYLLSTQRPDGSWYTAAKHISKADNPERLKVRDEIYEYWGTGWAALALAKTLP